jgi:hypothetical protein
MRRFEMGQLVATAGVNEWIAGDDDKMAIRSATLMRMLRRYQVCDWGEVDEEDCEANNIAVEEGQRIVASYVLEEDIRPVGERKVWIITEWDRSVTTVLFPSEY